MHEMANHYFPNQKKFIVLFLVCEREFRGDERNTHHIEIDSSVWYIKKNTLKALEPHHFTEI